MMGVGEGAEQGLSKPPPLCPPHMKKPTRGVICMPYFSCGGSCTAPWFEVKILVPSLRFLIRFYILIPVCACFDAPDALSDFMRILIMHI